MDEKMMKLEQLLNDPAEVEQVFVSDSKQTLANLAARGIEMTQEELEELAYGILDGSLPSENGELTEDALENVAGGKLKIGFFHGYVSGLIDVLKSGPNGTCKSTDGGLFYRLGYNCVMKKMGC